MASGALTGTHVKPEQVFTVAGADGRDYLLWKTFLNVAPSAAPYRSISVARPASARLYYADPNTWGNATDAEHVADATKRVRLPACGPEWAGYTGGIIVPGPACVTLTIAAPQGGARKQVTVPIARRHC